MKCRSFMVLLFAAAACALGPGCAELTSSSEEKTSSPRSDDGVRPERWFRKKPNVEETPEQQAVFDFLWKDKELFRAATAGLKADAQPSSARQAIAKYAEDLEKENKDGLPGTFQSAAMAYQQAVRGVPQALAPLPDGTFEGAKFYDALRAAFRGDAKAAKPLGGDVIKAVEGMREAGAKMYQSAGQFGIDADR